MTVLPGETILRLVKEGKLGIKPFYEDGIQPASYDARLGTEILVSPVGEERGEAKDLRMEKDKCYEIKTGQFVSVMTEEWFTFPNDICGKFGLRSEYTRKGLLAFGGIQIDPGWNGRLVISLFNIGPEPIPIKLGDEMFTIEFCRLESLTQNPYRGRYQNQPYFPAEDVNFILRARTVSLAEIKPIGEEISRLKNELALLKAEISRVQPEVEALAIQRLPLQFRVDMEKFNEIKIELLKNGKYRGKFVAIYRGELIGPEESEEKLNMVINEKYGNVPAYISKVAEEEEIAEFSSPELV